MKDSSNKRLHGIIAIGLLVLIGSLIAYFLLRDKQPEKSSRPEDAPRVVKPPKETSPEESVTPTPTEITPEQDTGIAEAPKTVEEFDITGTVVDKAGNPLEGADVQVFFYSWNDLSLESREGFGDSKPLKHKTREDGRFEFKYVEGKRYFMSAEKEDYVPVQKNLDGPERNMTITLLLGGAIEGQVVDAATLEPLEHFRIVTSEDTGGTFAAGLFKKKEVDIYLPEEGKEFNDPMGKFRVSGLSKAKYRLTSIAEGYAQSYKGGIDVKLEETVENVVIKQLPAGGIRGRVLDTAGKPIENAIIAQKNPLQSTLFGDINLGQRKSLAKTDSEGAFEIGSLPDGSFSLQARHEHYCPKEQKVIVKKGEITEGVEFQLVQGGVISGVVLAKVDLRPVEGAQVKAMKGTPSMLVREGVAEAKTDATGLFDLIGLEPDTYSVNVTAPDFAEKTIEGLALTENQGIADLIIELSQGGSIVGTVRDLSGTPLPKRMIVAVGPGGQKLGQTDELGKYAFVNMKEGVYVTSCVEVTPGMQMTASRADTYFVKVENDKETRQDIVVGGPRKIYGKVTLKGDPQSGLMIMAQTSQKAMTVTRTQKQASDQTDEDGNYEIDNLQPGEYRLIALRIASAMPRPLFETNVTVAAKDLEKDIELPEGGLSGKVVDAETRRPIEGAQVSAQEIKGGDAETAMMAKLGLSGLGGETTDAEGKYTLSTLEDGEYAVVASKDGYASLGLSAEVRNSRGPSDLDFSLSKGETLTGEVEGSDPSTPIKMIFLSVKDSGGRSVYSKRLTLSASGEYQAESLPTGECEVSVDAKGYASAKKTVRISAGSDNRADFVLTAGGTLIIKAVDDRGDPVQGAQSELKDDQGNLFLGLYPDLQELMNMGFEAIMREDGVSISEHIPEGAYQVTVTAFGYDDAHVNVSIREGQGAEETVTLRKKKD
jgi:protocatechuate 3,4-dioxygenase beta subunit